MKYFRISEQLAQFILNYFANLPWAQVERDNLKAVMAELQKLEPIEESDADPQGDGSEEVSDKPE